MTARRIFRWCAGIVLGAVGLVLVAAAATFGISEVRMAHKYTVSDHTITPRADSMSLATGARLVKVKGCAGCHGPNLGGSVMIDNLALGRLVAPNLSLGGRGAELEPRDWERAIRHG